MAKKKSKHKHSRSARKPAAPSNSGSSTAPASSGPAPLASKRSLAISHPDTGQPKPGILDSSNRWYYVRGDLRRISVLASLCIVLELALWYTLSYTPVGDQIYRLIKI